VRNMYKQQRESKSKEKLGGGEDNTKNKYTRGKKTK
jgi:hypothetical protein